MIDWDGNVLQPLMEVFGEAEDTRPVYQPAVGAAVPFDGVFDDGYKGLVMDSGGMPEIATLEPVIGVRLAQFPAGEPSQGGTVTIPRVGKTFVVSNVQPDGKGWAKLTLSRHLP